MKDTFENYLKQARTDFAKVAGKYTVTEHLELRTAIDSLLIAYDQAVAKALILPVVVKSVKGDKKQTFGDWLESKGYTNENDYVFKNGKFHSFKTLYLKYKNC